MLIHQLPMASPLHETTPPLHMNHAPHLSNHYQPDHPPPESLQQDNITRHSIENESLSGSTGMLVPPARAGSAHK